MGEEDPFSQSQDPVSGAAQKSFDIGKIPLEPVDPAQHGLKGWEFFGIFIFGCHNAIDYAGDYLSLIMFVWNKAVRQFIVIAAALGTTEPADHQMFLPPAFFPADTKSGIPVF